MVNTRRMESNGLARDSGPRHRTRKPDGIREKVHLSSDSDGEESQEEESNKPCHSKKKITLPSRVRELRSRFVCSDLKFTSHCVRKKQLRSSRKHISLDDRHTIAVYTNRNMEEDSDIYNDNDSEEEIFKPRSHRLRHKRTTKSALARIERRTALSLRPISLKSYADPHSPLAFNSDSDGEKDTVRRSTRTRKSSYENMSWLADNQMPKVGYPNFDSTEYSEDSRDAQVINTSNTHDSSLDRTRRTTRHSHKISSLSSPRKDTRNSKHLFGFENSGIHTRRRSKIEIDKPEPRSKEEVELVTKNGTDTNNKDIGRMNGKLRRLRKADEEKDEEHGDDDDGKGTTELEKEKEEHEEIQENNAAAEDKPDEASSESDVPRQIQTRKQANNHIIAGENRYPTRTGNHKISESSSSSEVGKVYSLRDRPPKPPSYNIRTRRVRNLAEAITRRRFNRRYKEPSSSDSSSDSDERCCKIDKYSKNSKSPYSKGDQRMKSGLGSKIIPIGPEKLDSNVRFSSIGGLDGHVQCLKEMILLPMMYPEVFRQFQIQPPRGVLFHGPPGTGKTLIARALANECSFGTHKVSFFMRKGADLLSKWIGESEKQLRLLFEQAAEMKPSIIFFDELDGLAPVRSSRQDQVHASIVSTLLALMDGLDNRGEVIVIGATNRIDAIDPALRRPGRFDRELLFPLPARKEREEILNVQVAQWLKPPSSQLMSYLAENAVGYCGSDLRALCSEAVIQGFRRTYPQVYTSEHRLQLDPDKVKVEKVDFLRAKSLLIPASQRIRHGLGRRLLLVLQPLLREPLQNTLKVLEQSFPHGVNAALAKVKLSANVKPAQLLLVGDGPDHGQTLHLAPAVLYHMEHIHSYILDLATLYHESGISAEEACVQVFNEARRNVPSVIYIPSIDQLWSLISETVRAIFIAQINQLDPNIPVLLLATADTIFNNLPEQVRKIFSRYRKEVFQINPPNSETRKEFFKPLIVDTCLRPPKPPRVRPTTPPPLPRAPTPAPAPLTEDQAKKVYEQEERTLRELRIFLRDMCKKLANNKLFYMFTKPVDTEEVPDYTTIIKQPMDLETMMTKVDFHRYECAQDFLSDIELIVQNALEYNPARTSADKQIRHRACSLRDYAYTLIKNEMDSDFEEKCQGIANKRRDRKVSVTQYLPPYINTPADDPGPQSTSNNTSNGHSNTKIVNKVSPCRKRKISSWQRGYLSNKKKKRRCDRPVLGETAAEDLNDDKMSSADEFKENNPQVCKLDKSIIEVVNNSLSIDESQHVPTNVVEPLTVNCDISQIKPEQVPSSPSKRRLSELLSPSELLDDPLEFDDIDQALNETVTENVHNVKSVDINVEELERVLDQAVKFTANHTLQSLLDLHSQLNRIIKPFMRTSARRNLPRELRKELSRFKQENTTVVSSSDTCSSPSQH